MQRGDGTREPNAAQVAGQCWRGHLGVSRRVEEVWGGLHRHRDEERMKKRAQSTLAEVAADEVSGIWDDALPMPEAVAVASSVLVNSIVGQHSQISATGAFKVDPSEAYEFLGPARVASLVQLIEMNRTPDLAQVIRLLVRDALGAAEYSFVDTDQIKPFVERIVAVAIVARDRWPELCKSWLERSDPPFVGEKAIAQVHKKLMIDEQWTTRLPNGFAWIASRLEQRVLWGPHFWSHAIWGTIVTSTTTVLRNVRASGDVVYPKLAAHNAFASGSMWHFEPSARELRLTSHYFAHEQSLDFRMRQHADYSILQLCEAEAAADGLAREFAGEVAVVPHPTNGRRETPDDMLNIVGDLFIPRGEGRSRFADAAEVEQARAQVAGRFAFSADLDGGWISVRIPLDTVVQYRIRLTTVPSHGVYGAGMSVTSTIERTLDEQRLWRLGAWLKQQQNESEDGRGYGAWARTDFGAGPQLSYCRFLPNAMFERGVIADALSGEVGRAQWIEARLSELLERAASD